MGYVLSESLSERAGFLPFLLWQRIAHDIVMFNQTSQNYLTMNSFVHMLCDKGTLWVDFVDGSSWCVSTPKCSQFTMMSPKYLIYWQIRHTRMKPYTGMPRNGLEGRNPVCHVALLRSQLDLWRSGEVRLPPTALQCGRQSYVFKQYDGGHD